MIRISNISFFRFCWKNGKLDWPKCARTELGQLASQKSTDKIYLLLTGTVITLLRLSKQTQQTTLTSRGLFNNSVAALSSCSGLVKQTNYNDKS